MTNKLLKTEVYIYIYIYIYINSSVKSKTISKITVEVLVVKLFTLLVLYIYIIDKFCCFMSFLLGPSSLFQCSPNKNFQKLNAIIGTLIHFTNVCV